MGNKSSSSKKDKSNGKRTVGVEHKANNNEVDQFKLKPTLAPYNAEQPKTTVVSGKYNLKFYH